MRVLVACEFSGIVRDAFAVRGHDAWSCDLLPTERPGNHYQDDVRSILREWSWDLVIAHPPCTYLAVSGARWFAERRDLQALALGFILQIAAFKGHKLAIENPVSVLSSHWRKADQTIQPWWFGHGETKATCLWLRGLPPLVPTDIVDGRDNRVHKEPPSEDRWKNRSRTLPGIAKAMAEQWG